MNKIKKAQSTLELTLSLVVLVILLAGMIKVFSWSSRCIVDRHNAYRQNFRENYNNPNEFYSPPTADFVPEVRGIDNRSPYSSSIEEAINLLRLTIATLQGLRNGEFYYNMVLEKSINIVYGSVPAYVNGLWDSSTNTIYINQNLQENAPESAIAALICHEMTHADYSYNPAYWLQITKTENPQLSDSEMHIPGDSIDQEYKAFYNEARIYEALRTSDGTDIYWDGLVNMIDQGEEYAKSIIAISYEDYNLPDY